MPALKVLVAGLDPAYPERHVPNYDGASLRAALAAATEEIAAIPNLTYHVAYLDLDDPAAVPDLKKLVAAEPWDAIVIGFGVRGSKALTAEFEDWINYIVQTRPGARLCFTDGPDEFCKGLRRQFPGLGQEE